MATKKVEMELPAELFPCLGVDQKQVERSVLEAVVLELVRSGTISASFGAEILRLKYQDFLNLMADHNVPMVDYPPDELENEVDLLKRTAR